jgi:hypothetical protein
VARLGMVLARHLCRRKCDAIGSTASSMKARVMIKLVLLAFANKRTFNEWSVS